MSDPEYGPRMSHRFHTRDRSAFAMFWRSHDRVMDRLRLFAEIQASDNPLTDDERRRLAKRHPDRYGFMWTREDRRE